MTDTHNKLKPCPFCGDDDPSDDRKDICMPGYAVACSTSGCPIEGVVFTKTEWNTRALEAKVDHTEMLREVREALENMVETYQYEASLENPSLLNARAILAKLNAALGETP